jgi:hypothetical protein
MNLLAASSEVSLCHSGLDPESKHIYSQILKQVQDDAASGEEFLLTQNP